MCHPGASINFPEADATPRELVVRYGWKAVIYEPAKPL
jgi:hypothetical protein